MTTFVLEMDSKIITYRYQSPCGELMLGSYDGKLCMCDWAAARHHCRVADRLHRSLLAELVNGISPTIQAAAGQLDEYFAGVRSKFDLPLLFVGTPFQKEVWEVLRTIPYGTTISYGEEARLIGSDGAVRAVANANGANAISVIVPCHRVIGSNGLLTGYGGGIDAKKYLLGHERRVVGRM